MPSRIVHIQNASLSDIIIHIVFFNNIVPNLLCTESEKSSKPISRSLLGGKQLPAYATSQNGLPTDANESMKVSSFDTTGYHSHFVVI